MKQFLLLALLFSCFTVKVFSQQLLQYNTGTLFDSFENPAQRAFIPDSSRYVAFNFFIPNGGANFVLTGNAQQALKSRAFGGKYDTRSLVIGGNQMNNAYVNANEYSIMAKLFTSFKGDQEVGFFFDTRGDGHSRFSDESVALFNGPNGFPKDAYNNIFNDYYYYQIYHEVGFTYHERIDKQFSIGFKVAAVLGSTYSSLNIVQSSISFDKPTDQALLALSGVQQYGYEPGKFDSHDLLPSFRNPGASVTMGLSYRTDQAVTIQANVKDLGFIHWNKRSGAYVFNNNAIVNGLSTAKREDSIYNQVYNIIHTGSFYNGSFTTPTDGRAEISASKMYYIDDDHQFRYFPTFVASKELFYNGFTAAVVNRVQRGIYNLSLDPSYDNLNHFNMGIQFMVQSPNVEFFIGTESLIPTGRFLLASTGSSSQIEHPSSFTAGTISLGFSAKFGRVIEHPMNSSYIPMGEKGFFGRLWNRIFKTDK